MSQQTPTVRLSSRNTRSTSTTGSGSGNRLKEPWMSLLRLWVIISMITMTVLTVLGAGPRFQQVNDQAVRYAAELAQAGMPQWVYVAIHFWGAVPFLTLFPALALLIFFRRNDDWTAMVQAFALFATGMNGSVFAEALIKGITPMPFFQALFTGNTQALIIPPIDFIRAASENFSIIALVFIPTGRAEPRWMRYPAFAVLIYGVVRTFFYGTQFNTQSWPSGLQSLWFLATLGLGVFSMVYRYRNVSTQVHKQQQKWIILGIAIGVGGVVILKAIPGLNPALVLNAASPTTASVTWSMIDYLIFVIVEIPIPVALAFAILRYRLWDIDFYINRTLVYGALTAILVAVFGGTLFGLNALFESVPALQGVPGIALAGSALVVGILFQPARNVIRRFVDHLYGIEIDYKGALQKEAAIVRVLAVEHDTRTSFGSYTNIELLGRGGMGEVYRATHPTLNRFVAIKLLPAALATNVEARKRFIREAQTIAKLKHPHIVGIQDFGEVNDIPYMVMDYIDGSNLGDVIKQRGRLPMKECIPNLEDIASALDYAHEEGIVHRDIKPSNMMIQKVTGTNSERQTKTVLMDFGIAKIIHGESTRLTQTGMIGTLDYIAPEQIQGSDEVDGRADIYSFGIVAYQLLTGQLPFTRANPAAMLLAHLMEPPPDPRHYAPDLPDSANFAILRAMSKKPEDRYNSAAEMVMAMAG